jgi:hypothetical protein
MSIQAPIYKEWDAFSELVERDKILMEFRLVYQGVLNSTGNKSASGRVHAIRRYFHPQLVNLWDLSPILRPFSGRSFPSMPQKSYETFTPPKHELIQTYTHGGKSYLPIVCMENKVTCGIEILLLRRDLSAVLVSGDLDGRVKTLIDALRIPKIGEDTADDDPSPLHCLLSDDSLISEVKVTADHLLASPEQVIEHPKTTPDGEYKASTNHVLAVINVKTRGTERNLWT